MNSIVYEIVKEGTLYSADKIRIHIFFKELPLLAQVLSKAIV